MFSLPLLDARAAAANFKQQVIILIYLFMSIQFIMNSLLFVLPTAGVLDSRLQVSPFSLWVPHPGLEYGVIFGGLFEVGEISRLVVF